MHGCVQNGGTPMFSAAGEGHSECIKVLAHLGGDVNKVALVRRKAHCCGCTWWHSQLDERCIVCCCVQGGVTPMFFAAYQGHKECIEVLAGLGADVHKAQAVSVDALRQLWLSLTTCWV